MPPRKRAAAAFAAVSKKAAKTEDNQTLAQAIETPVEIQSPEREELSQKRVRFYSNPNEQSTSSDSDTEEVDYDLKDSEDGLEPQPLVSYLPEVGCIELHVPQICNAIGDLLKHFDTSFNPIVAESYNHSLLNVAKELSSYKWCFQKSDDNNLPKEDAQPQKDPEVKE